MTASEKIEHLKVLCNDEEGKLRDLVVQIIKCGETVRQTADKVVVDTNKQTSAARFGHIDIPNYQGGHTSELRELVIEYNTRLLWFRAVRGIVNATN